MRVYTDHFDTFEYQRRLLNNRYDYLFTFFSMNNNIFERNQSEVIDLVEINGYLTYPEAHVDQNDRDHIRGNEGEFKVLSALYDHRLINALMYDEKPNTEPIIGYEKEPLVPLIQACLPLVDLVDNILFYAQIALNATAKEPADQLTIDESAAIRLYTMEWQGNHRSLYSMLNRTLKYEGRDRLKPYHTYMKLFLTAMAKIPCTSEQTVWRGVTKNMSHQFPRGKTVIWWGFSSCTTSLTVLENQMYLGRSGARTLFSVEAMNARNVRAHSHFVTEDEVLLLPGTYMEVQSQFSPAPDLYVIHLKQIKPKEILLASPFEGALLFPSESNKRPWYRKKRTFIQLAILVLLCIAALIIGAVVGSRRKAASIANTFTGCIPRQSNVNADYLWSFDCADAREDLIGLDNGTAVNGANYSSPDFSGQGRALTLDRNRQQYISLQESFNLTSNTSFTVSFWIYRTGFSFHAMLTDCNVLTSTCLTFMIGDTTIYIGVINDTTGEPLDYKSISIADLVYQSCWVYLTFAFVHPNQNLTIYHNGDHLHEFYIELNRSRTPFRQNRREKAYIGLDLTRNPHTFNGMIDQLSIAYYSKNASEILDEATFLCSYTFEDENITRDSGPQNIPAKGENVYRLLSNNQTSLLINSTKSYFQFSGMTILQSNGFAYSIAFWLRLSFGIYNQSNTSVAILQFTSKVDDIVTSDYRCISTLHIDVENRTMIYYIPRTYQMLRNENYKLENNTWTHIGISYKSKHIIQMYINGKSTSNFTDSRFGSLLTGNPRVAITFGAIYLKNTNTTKLDNYPSMKCFAEVPILNYTQMNGEIDDIKFFSRTLTSSEFASLGTRRGSSHIM